MPRGGTSVFIAAAAAVQPQIPNAPRAAFSPLSLSSPALATLFFIRHPAAGRDQLVTLSLSQEKKL